MKFCVGGGGLCKNSKKEFALLFVVQDMDAERVLIDVIMELLRFPKSTQQGDSYFFVWQAPDDRL
jgi:hypothetical protein